MTVCFAPCPVVFNLDGTLIDSAPDAHAAANAVLRENGLGPLRLDTIRSLMGGGVDDLWHKIIRHRRLNPAWHREAVAAFMVRYHNSSALTRLFPGVLEALGDLADRGHPMGICSNKPVASITASLDSFGLSGIFDQIIGADSIEEQKPNAAPLRAALAGLGADPAAPHGLFIGDGVLDAASATAVPVPFVLFTRGYRQLPIAELPHHAAFDDFTALPALVEEYGMQTRA